jgi:hypothetical protein
VHAGPWRHLLWIVLHDNGDLLTALSQQCGVAPGEQQRPAASKSTPAIATWGLLMLANKPRRAVIAAMVRLLVTDHADRVRAIRSVSVWTSRSASTTMAGYETAVRPDIHRPFLRSSAGFSRSPGAAATALGAEKISSLWPADNLRQWFIGFSRAGFGTSSQDVCLPPPTRPPLRGVRTD